MRAVLFDLDDTLIDQRSAMRAAVVPWAAEQGVTGAGVMDRWDAIAERHYARYQRRECTFQEQRRARVRDLLGLDLSDEAADAVFGRYLERYEAGWALLPGAVAALTRVRAAGLRVGILTNGDEDQQRRKLDAFGLSRRVDVLIASSALPAGKPDPRAFAAAVSRLRVAAQEVLMVGDSLEKDVRGALAAGLQALLFDPDGRHTDTDVPRISSLDQLLPSLRAVSRT